MSTTHSLALLRRFVPPREAAPHGRCDLCGSSIFARHRHLFDPASRRLICACDACALLFPSDTKAKYVLVSRRVLKLENFVITDGEWDTLGIPIGLAFFARRSDVERIGLTFPSPAGSTEAELPLDAWRELAEGNPVLNTLEADVETLLVNRTRHHRDYYIAPIDRCYELTGLVRKHWRGLSGGSTVWEAIDGFFEQLAPVRRA